MSEPGSDFGERLEREFVRLIADLAGQQGLSYSQFAKRAFCQELSPEVKWRQIRNTSKGGKPQRLSMADAVRCAEALGLYFPALCFRAVEMLHAAGCRPADTKKTAG